MNIQVWKKCIFPGKIIKYPILFWCISSFKIWQFPTKVSIFPPDGQISWEGASWFPHFFPPCEYTTYATSSLALLFKSSKPNCLLHLYICCFGLKILINISFGQPKWWIDFWFGCCCLLFYLLFSKLHFLSSIEPITLGEGHATFFW